MTSTPPTPLTLLLRLAGPMQSWGTSSRFRDRDTGQEPSKSGVVGLLCAALGRPREAPMDDLAALPMGVRVDQPGVVRVDYQTAGGTHHLGARYGVARAENPGTETAISRRAYLADAAFLVGLGATTPAQAELLYLLDAAVAAPVWPLYLGRKSYTPGVPLRLPDAPPLGPGLRSAPLEDALATQPRIAARAERAPRAAAGQVEYARLVIECAPDDRDAQERADWPLSFAPLDRRYMTRFVRTSLIPLPPPAADVGGRQ